MKQRLVLATQNLHKVEEMAAMLNGMPYEVVTAAAYPELPVIEEDGETFAANALKKARVTAEATGQWSLADDSGLVVDALGGRPGVHSARYAGEPKSDLRNNHKLLQELAHIPAAKRSACFVCTMALVTPGGDEFVVEGTCSGSIAFELRGEHGFGYDPLFIVDKQNKTMAQLGPEVKNRISHRFRALEQVKELLRNLNSSS